MSDKFTVRAVVLGLVVITILGLTGLIWLVDHGADPTLLLVVSGPTTTALGALGAVLVSTRTVVDEPQQVTVMNPPGDPVPVEDADAPAKRTR